MPIWLCFSEDIGRKEIAEYFISRYRYNDLGKLQRVFDMCTSQKAKDFYRDHKKKYLEKVTKAQRMSYALVMGA